MLKTNWRQKNVEQREQYMQQEKTFDFVITGDCLTELSSVWNFRIFSPLLFISIAHSIQTWSRGFKVGYIQLQLLSDSSTKKQKTWKDGILTWFLYKWVSERKSGEISPCEGGKDHLVRDQWSYQSGRSLSCVWLPWNLVQMEATILANNAQHS